MVHFLDATEDAVNTAMGRQPRGVGELLGGVGGLEEIMKGLAYIVETLEYGYRNLPTVAGDLQYVVYPGEPDRDADEVRTELLDGLNSVKRQLESTTIPALQRSAFLAARLREGTQGRQP